MAAPVAAGRGRVSGDSHVRTCAPSPARGNLSYIRVSSQVGLRPLPFKQDIVSSSLTWPTRRERENFGAWRSWSIALALGARGRRFESFRSDQI